MNSVKKRKILIIFVIMSMLSTLLFSFMSNVEAYPKLTYFYPNEQFRFNADDILRWAADSGAGVVFNKDVDRDDWPGIPTMVTDEMISDKTAIRIDPQGGSLNAADAAMLMMVSGLTKPDSFGVGPILEENLGISQSDITIEYTVDFIEINGIGGISEKFSAKYDENEGKFVWQLSEEQIEQYQKNKKDYTEAINKAKVTKENISDASVVSLKVNISGNSKYNGWVYRLCLAGGNPRAETDEEKYKYVNEWMLIKEDTAEPIISFNTDLTYTSKIGSKDVGGINKNGTWMPGYDKDDVEKDADVTATITSKTDNDIVKVNGIDLNADGSVNELNWYYPDVNNKKVIAKIYKFDDYDNLTAVGKVEEKNIKLSSSDQLEDTQDVSIKWPFRIIKVTQEPQEIKEGTDKIRVEITTNLPMDENKLPKDWKFTDDEEGKTQHRIFIEVERGKTYEEEVVVTEKDSDETDKTDVKVEWPNFKTELDYIALIGTKNVGGETRNGTFYPSYDKNDIKKDADVTATITSKTGNDIVKVDGIELKSDGSANGLGWYYPDVNDKKVISKIYKFDDYDNTTANGKVKETVKLTSIDGEEDTQTPSIIWAFRIIDVDEKTNDDGSITVVIEYNLPVDPESIPNDWSPIYDEDGKTVHKIKRTIKKGEDYDKDVTVKQNGTDETRTTHVKKIWEKLPVILPQTGETLAIVVAGGAILLGVAVISYRKFKK